MQRFHKEICTCSLVINYPKYYLWVTHSSYIALIAFGDAICTTYCQLLQLLRLVYREMMSIGTWIDKDSEDNPVPNQDKPRKNFQVWTLYFLTRNSFADVTPGFQTENETTFRDVILDKLVSDINLLTSRPRCKTLPAIFCSAENCSQGRPSHLGE